MSNAILPKYYYRRAWLRAFWTTAVTCGAAFVAVALYALGAATPVLMSFGALLMVSMVLGWLRPATASVPFKVARKAQEHFNQLARSYVAGLCYFLVVLPVGRLGAGGSAQQSGWRERSARAGGADSGQHVGSSSGSAGGLKPYLRWARESGQPGALALVPFLIVLSALGDGTEMTDVPAETYTLY